MSFLTAMLVRLRGRSHAAAARHDSELHRSRAETAAEIEEHDIDAMVDAIAERRRRRGGRDVGEELGDELLRASWDEE
jgi:hypothetical protein